MSQIIGVLESLAKMPVWVGARDYDRMVADLEVSEDQRVALEQRDGAALAAAMQLNTSMFCMVVAPDGQESDEQPAPDEAPDQQDDESEDVDQ